MTTLQSLLTQASKQLSSSSDSPRLDAELLLAHCLQKERSYLYAWGDKVVDESIQQTFKQLIEKRLTDYPVAYLLGHREFWSLDLKVSEDVLIPRPETERLVEVALEKIQHCSTPTILDLGTGSGAIALSIGSERTDALITASDSSAKALAIAQYNAQKNALANVNFILSDWFSGIPQQPFDLIVSNPPYIKSDDAHLQQGIRHEPLQALAAGKTGLDDIKTILHSALSYMKQGAWIIIEHGYDQGKVVPQLMQKAGFQRIDCLKDYNDNERLSIAKKG
jgi:release factor glutamine methyltransferase